MPLSSDEVHDEEHHQRRRHRIEEHRAHFATHLALSGGVDHAVEDAALAPIGNHVLFLLKCGPRNRLGFVPSAVGGFDLGELLRGEFGSGVLALGYAVKQPGEVGADGSVELGLPRDDRHFGTVGLGCAAVPDVGDGGRVAPTVLREQGQVVGYPWRQRAQVPGMLAGDGGHVDPVIVLTELDIEIGAQGDAVAGKPHALGLSHTLEVLVNGVVAALV